MTIEAKLDETNTLLKQLIGIMGSKPSPKAATLPPEARNTPPAEITKSLTYDDVKAPFLDLVKSKGRDAGLKVLAQFKAEKLPDVKPIDFAAVLVAIQAAGKAETVLA